MPTRKTVAKSSKAGKSLATRKPAARKAVTRKPAARVAAAAHSGTRKKPSVAKATPSRTPVAVKAHAKESVPKTNAHAASAKHAKSAATAEATPALVTPSPVRPSIAKKVAKPRARSTDVPSQPAGAPAVTAVAVRTSSAASLDEFAGPSAAYGADGDDGDEGHNLLAGPRNVKPYIVKRGEQYMSKLQMEHFRSILLAWKRDLMVEVDRTVTHMKDEAANFPDPNDRATQEEEFSLELRTRDRERKLIRKIEEAIKRIEDGSYGYCLETGEEIGVKRLEARPVATLSLEAQERRERREKQYGDRDDRYR